MKKRLLALLLVLVLSASSLTACGVTDPMLIGRLLQSFLSTDDAPEAGDVEEEEEDDYEGDSWETLEEEEARKSQPKDYGSKDAYIKEHGLKISKQGDFTFTTSTSEDELVDVEGTVVITETTKGCEEGMKKVICEVYEDFGENHGWMVWNSAFDRYTGTSFEFDDYLTTQSNGGDAQGRDGYVKIKNGDLTYKISVEFESEVSEDNVLHHYTIVTCPEDYDGTVFYAGCSSNFQREIFTNMDISDNLYLDYELPYNEETCGQVYYYFTNTDN